MSRRMSSFHLSALVVVASLILVSCGDDGGGSQTAGGGGGRRDSSPTTTSFSSTTRRTFFPPATTTTTVLLPSWMSALLRQAYTRPSATVLTDSLTRPDFDQLIGVYRSSFTTTESLAR